MPPRFPSGAAVLAAWLANELTLGEVFEAVIELTAADRGVDVLAGFPADLRDAIVARVRAVPTDDEVGPGERFELKSSCARPGVVSSVETTEPLAFSDETRRTILLYDARHRGWTTEAGAFGIDADDVEGFCHGGQNR